MFSAVILETYTTDTENVLFIKHTEAVVVEPLKHAQFVSTTQLLLHPSPSIVLLSSQPYWVTFIPSPQIGSQFSALDRLYPVVHEHVAVDETWKFRVELQAKQLTSPPCSTAEVHPVMLVQTPVTKWPDVHPHIPLDKRIKPGKQVVQTDVLTHVSHPDM